MKKSIVLLFFVMVSILVGPYISSSSMNERATLLHVITGNETMGRLNNPSGLFFDEVKKRLYVADSGNNRLLSFDKDMVLQGEFPLAKNILPLGFVKTREGHFYVVDGGRGGILNIFPKNNSIEPFEIKALPDGDLFVPGRIAVDREMRLYIIDRLGRRIVIVDKEGRFIEDLRINEDGFWGFNDVRVDNDKGLIYTLDTRGRTVYIFNEKGEVVGRFGNRGMDNERGRFYFPVSLAVSDGFVYVLDQHKGEVLVYREDGKFLYSISRPGVKEGELIHPSYIYIDKGKIYVIDGNRIQVFLVK